MIDGVIKQFECFGFSGHKQAKYILFAVLFITLCIVYNISRADFADFARLNILVY